MNNSDILNNLEWQGNSEMMYEAILKSIPPMFAGGVKNGIINWIKKNNIRVVTEDLVFKAVDDIAPANISNNMIKPQLNKLRSGKK